MSDTTTVRHQDDCTLVLERVFPTTPERLFDAWTNPETLTRWWGPEGMTTPEVAMDVRPDGRWRTVMTNDEGAFHTVSGVYREISPPDRLILTWGWEREDGSRGHETEIILTFEPVQNGTRLRLVQSVFETPEQRDNHNMGWSSSLNDLGRMFG